MDQTWIWSRVSKYLYPEDVISLSVTCKAASNIAKRYDRSELKLLMSKHARYSYERYVTLWHFSKAVNRTCALCSRHFTGKFYYPFNVYAHKTCVRNHIFNEYYLNCDSQIHLKLTFAQFAKLTKLPFRELVGYSGGTYSRGNYEYRAFWKSNDGHVPPMMTVEWALQHHPLVKSTCERNQREEEEYERVERERIRIEKEKKAEEDKRKAEETVKRAEHKAKRKRLREEAKYCPMLRKKLRDEEAAEALMNRRIRFVSRFGQETLDALECQNFPRDAVGDFFEERKMAKTSLKQIISRFPKADDLMLHIGDHESLKTLLMDQLSKKLNCTCTDNMYCDNCLKHMVHMGWIDESDAFYKEPAYMNVYALFQFGKQGQLIRFRTMYYWWKRNQAVPLDVYFAHEPDVDFQKSWFVGRKRDRYFGGGPQGIGYYRVNTIFECKECKAIGVEPSWIDPVLQNKAVCKPCDVKRFTSSYTDQVTEENMMEYILTVLLLVESKRDPQMEKYMTPIVPVVASNRDPAMERYPTSIVPVFESNRDQVMEGYLTSVIPVAESNLDPITGRSMTLMIPGVHYQRIEM